MRLALVLCLAFLLAAGASPTVSARAVDAPCGVATDALCWTETFACRIVLNETGRCVVDSIAVSGACTNYGVVAQVTILGRNRYCVGEECYNHGVIVMVGSTRSCHGDGLALVCTPTTGCIVASTHAVGLESAA